MSQDPAPPPVLCRVGHAVPARDGTVLRADFWWLHHDRPQPRPAVLSFTPYGRDRCAPSGRFFAERGFLFVAVDCRGRGDSDGSFELYGDGDDMADAVAWLAAQPECDGRVVTQGGSYAGINQWQVAARRPAALAAIAPMVAPMPGFDSDCWGGIVPLYNLLWATLVQGRLPKWGLFADTVLARDTFARIYLEAQPSSSLPLRMTAPANPVLAKMVRPFDPADWACAVPSDGELAAMDLPALSLTGLYDNAQRGAIRYFERHDACAGAAGRDRRFLVIGPSAHAGHRVLGPDDGVDLHGVALATDAWQDRLCADFYRWALGDGPRPALLADRVSVFVAGLERWFHAPGLAALGAGHWTLYPAAGALQADPGAAHTVPFRSDPLDERHAGLEASGAIGPLLDALSCEAPLDGGSLKPEHYFGQGLHWDGEVLAQPRVLCGPPQLWLGLSTDLPDADLLAALLVLHPDGRQVVLSATMLRLRHRDGLDRPARLMTPGLAETVEFPAWRLAARRVASGCRLRLVLRVPASIAFERQMNAARPVAEQTRDDARAGTVTVHLGAGSGSRLSLPLLDEALPSSPPDVAGG